MVAICIVCVVMAGLVAIAAIALVWRKLPERDSALVRDIAELASQSFAQGCNQALALQGTRIEIKRLRESPSPFPGGELSPAEPIAAQEPTPAEGEVDLNDGTHEGKRA